MLTWQTASEENNEGFNVEHSLNGRDWETLDFIEGKGSSVEINNYSYIHKSPSAGVNYYRLKQLDIDGNFEYSSIIDVTVNDDDFIAVFPNPATNLLSFNGLDEENPFIEIHNSFGHLVLQQKLTKSELDISALPSGVFVLTIQLGNKKVFKRNVKK